MTRRQTNKLLVIYTTPGTDWHVAKAWAKENMVMCEEARERCYRGPNMRATHFYSNNEKIITDYGRVGAERLQP